MKSLKKLIYPRCTHNLMKNGKMFLNASSRIFPIKTHGYILNSLHLLNIQCNSHIYKNSVFKQGAVGDFEIRQ